MPVVHVESTVAHGWECTYSRSVRGDSSLEVGPGVFVDTVTVGGGGGGAGGSAISTCWGQINKPYITPQRKPVLPVGCTDWTHRHYLWISRLFWRERGWNELQVRASLSRYDYRTEFFIVISLNFHPTSFWTTWWWVGWWNDEKQLRRSAVGGLVSLKVSD